MPRGRDLRTQPGYVENRFVGLLPPGQRDALEAELEIVDLPLGKVLYASGGEIDWLYFPCGSVISLVTEMEDGRSVEAATVGTEGMVGLPAYLGMPYSWHHVVVQVPGCAGRMPAARLEHLLTEAPLLRGRLGRYADAMITAMSQAAACLALHPVHERCARWILMTSDRSSSLKFKLTHEFLATMLGVQRPTVTIAAGMLQAAGMLKYHHGQIEILDRTMLAQGSCECYQTITDTIERVFVIGD